jgi:hypothetical protein
MAEAVSNRVAQAVREAAHPLTGASSDCDPLLELVGDARFVLIGEASHGTHEFYRERAQITIRLIKEKGITADLKASDEDAISIMVGETPDGHLTHVIAAPSHVRLEQTQEGASEALQIESTSGATTLLRFRSAMLREMVDGVVLE